jgi:D-sedoheptulose 7-phosphate isomerase
MDSETYFRRLYGLLSETLVTDGQGLPINLDTAIDKVISMLRPLSGQPPKVMAVGNGGSAAIVSHLVADLCKALGVRAMTFTEVPLLTAFANDLSYQDAYENHVELFADCGDVLWAVSSSGCSQNILKAVSAARIASCSIITFSGFEQGNPLRSLGDINFYIASTAYGLVEVAHTALCHCITDHALHHLHVHRKAKT